MKGVVFTEFLEMVEAHVSDEVADQVIDETEDQLASGGIYTAVGSYPHTDMLTLVTKLSEITGKPVPELVNLFGKYLFGRFFEGYPGFFANTNSAFDFLSGIETYIHSEVRKLYPDAQLPYFECEQPNPHTLIMDYKSERPFADLAEGLIEGCIDHFKESISIAREDFAPAEGVHSRFTLTKADKSP